MFILFSTNKKFIFSLKFLVISLLLIPNKSNHSTIIESNEFKLSELKSEFHSFLKKYKSNSCIIQIFSNFQHHCENITDEINSMLSLEMTLCLYDQLDKKINSECKDRNYSNCLKYLEGDAWTTYITFSHHIENLCFYHKTLLWEKSSEFLFMKLFNASVGILSEMSQSSKLAQEMITTHERFSSQIEQNFVETVNNFKNFNQFFENYTKSEELLRDNIEALETKINKSNQKMNTMTKYIDEKLEYFYSFIEIFHSEERNSNSFSFFLILLSIAFIISSFKSTKKIRMMLILLIMAFFFVEKYFLTSLCNVYCKNSHFFIQLGFVCCHILFYSFRILFLICLLIILMIKCYKYNQSKKDKYEFINDYKSYLNITPMWMKKYFSRIKFQNEELIGKFKKMNKMMAEEKLLMINRNEERKNYSSEEEN